MRTLRVPLFLAILTACISSNPRDYAIKVPNVLRGDAFMSIYRASGGSKNSDMPTIMKGSMEIPNQKVSVNTRLTAFTWDSRGNAYYARVDSDFIGGVTLFPPSGADQDWRVGIGIRNKDNSIGVQCTTVSQVEAISMAFNRDRNMVAIDFDCTMYNTSRNVGSIIGPIDLLPEHNQ